MICLTSGLIVDSDVAFAGRCASPDSPPGLTIRRVRTGTIDRSAHGRRIAELHVGDRLLRTITDVDEDGWRIDFCGYAVAAVSTDLTRVDIEPDSEEAAALLSVLVAGPVLAFVLTMRAVPLLHGSAVSRQQRAIAFTGPSGGGKSTLAGMLAAQGAALITDDILAFYIGDDQISVLPGSPELRLRSGATALADTLRSAARQTSADERHVIALGGEDAAPVPLLGVVVPRLSREVEDPSVRTLSGAEAVIALLRCPRLPDLVTTEAAANLFTTCTAVAERVPVIEAVLPWQEHLRLEVPDQLARLLEEAVGWH